MSPVHDADALGYREVPDGDVEAFERILSYAFAPTEPFEFDPDDGTDGPLTLASPRGLYDGEDLVATVGHHWLDLWVRGAWRSVAGVSAVATPPKYRRQGFVRRLLAASLTEYRERGSPFAALWPFSHPFYGQYGWRTLSRYARTEFDPEAAADTDDLDAGRFVDLGAGDWARLDGVRSTGPRQPFTMDRTEEWWRERTVSGWGDADPYVAGWERDGRLGAYLVYEIEDGDDGRTMDVSEIAYREPAGLESCLRYCRLHDSQVSTARLHGPPWEARRLQELAADPRAFEVELHPGPMVRIVDVRALAELAVGDATLVLDVADPLVDWNDGRFRLSADGCERTDAAADATVGVGTLSGIAAGAVPSGRATWVDDLEPEADGDAVEALAALFPASEEPFLREGF